MIPGYWQEQQHDQAAPGAVLVVAQAASMAAALEVAESFTVPAGPAAGAGAGAAAAAAA